MVHIGKYDSYKFLGSGIECVLGARLFPIWYIGAIDLPYTEDMGILMVESWNGIKHRMEIRD